MDEKFQQEQLDLKQKLKKSLLVTCLVLLFCGLLYDRITQKVNITDQYIENGNIVVFLDGEGQCFIGDGMENAEWVNTDENNTCVMPLVSKGNIYIRNRYRHLCQVLEDQRAVKRSFMMPHTPALWMNRSFFPVTMSRLLR